MQLGSIRTTTAAGLVAIIALAILLMHPIFAANSCALCDTTNIVLSEKNGTVKIVVLQVSRTMENSRDLPYFDEQVKNYLKGASGTPKNFSVFIGRNVTQVENASVYVYYYNRTGGKVSVTDSVGNQPCNPLKTNNTEVETYQIGSETQVIIFNYGICEIPKEIYANSAVTLYFEYRGDQVRKPSEKELTIYDVNAGGLNALSDAVQNRAGIDPSSPQCMAGMIMLGLLLASMYFSGKSPISYLDITVPRVAKPKPISFGTMMGGSGNIRLGKTTYWQRIFLDKLVKKYTNLEMRAGLLSPFVASAIKESKSDAITKYFSAIEARKGGDNWKKMLKENNTVKLFNENRDNEKLPQQLRSVMIQRIGADKLGEGMGTVGGHQPQWVRSTIAQIRKVPLIGSYIQNATGSLFFGYRTGTKMFKTAASPLVRKTMGENYNLDKPRTGVSKFFYDVAAFTDKAKLRLGAMMPFGEYVSRFYNDARDAMYEEVARNIIWMEIHDQLSKNIKNDTKLREMIAKQMNLREILKNPEFLEALNGITIHKDYLNILTNSKYSQEKMAEGMIAVAKALHPRAELVEQAKRAYDDVRSIDRTTGLTEYDKAQMLVTHMRKTYKIAEPHDISENIVNGKFFITTGRDNLYYEEGGVRKNFTFLALGIKEFIDQTVFMAMKKRPGLETFGIEDAFKIAWLKIKDQVFGNRGFEDSNDSVTAYDPVLGKSRKMSFLKDVLNFEEADFEGKAGLKARTKEYMKSLLSKDGAGLLSSTVDGEGNEHPEKLLVSGRFAKRQMEEETAPAPWKRRYYYESTTPNEDNADPENWRANMDFVWQMKNGINEKLTAAYEVRGEKYNSSTPPQEHAWRLVETFMDNRISQVLNGSQLDLYGDRTGQSNRFSRVNMHKDFNETWKYYTSAREGLAEFYASKTGSAPANNEALFKFLGDPKNRQLTYKDLSSSKMPFIYTHDMHYVPYVKGMPVSDFDRVVNGVFVVDGKDGKRSTYDFQNRSKYEQEMGSDQELVNDLRAVDQKRRLPSKDDLDHLEKLLSAQGMGRINLHEKIVKTMMSGDEASALATIADLRNKIKSGAIDAGLKAQMLRSLDNIDPALMPLRQLTHEEIQKVKEDILASKISNEAKVAFIYKFSQSTHDWETLWTDRDLNFFRLVTEREIDASQRGWIGRNLTQYFGSKTANKFYDALRGVAGEFEVMAMSTGQWMSKAQSNNVAVSELYRERGHTMRREIKSGDFTKNLALYGGGALSEEDAATLRKDYDSYANIFQRFFLGWTMSVTRDPRGSSTQWGRQWYLATMYHRGPAMPGESQEMERQYFSPMGWFLGQVYYRPASINWMLGSPIVRMMRGFQTATFGYPSRLDKGIYQGGQHDMMSPWQSVNYTGIQKWRALLNPAESVFNLGAFKIPSTIARSLQVIPGLNMLQHFFPKKLEPGGDWAGGAALQDSKIYKTLANVPGLKSIMNQSQAQRSMRISKDIVDGGKQSPEDFPQYKGGGFMSHFTESANPGLSYIDWAGRPKLEARMSRFLVSELNAPDTEKGNDMREFYAEDPFLKRQASATRARRMIGAEAKRLNFQEELTGYGWRENPMWMPISSPTFIYWMGKWGKSFVDKNVNRVSELSKKIGGTAPQTAGPSWAQEKYTAWGTDVHTCAHCGGRGKARRGQKCSTCGRYGG